jgi:PKD repeat protein
MLHQRCLRAAALGCGLAIAASTAHAVPLDCTGTMSPTGSPIALSTSKHYFIYKNVPITLLGQTYEYICQIDQSSLAGRDSTYCTLNTYKGDFTTMQSKKNNVIRQEAIFDHSPGWMSKCNECGLTPCNGPTHTCCGDVFPHEQPFVFSGGKWDLNHLDSIYFDNLENVVCDAYKKDIIVEVSLFNVWDGQFIKSPFNKDNTADNTGFTAQQYFMTFDSNPDNYGTAFDNDHKNQAGRAAQRRALTEAVNRLKKYPNVIWEVANEPDLVTLSNVTREQVLVWQESMIDTLVALDTTHLIEMEGHTDTTFAWLEMNGKNPNPAKRWASVESAHYVDIGRPDLQNPQIHPYKGALKVVRNNYATIPDPQMPLGFNENKAVPNSPAIGTCPAGITRTQDAGRPEAWEFMMNGGGLFNGYSFNKSDTGAMTFSAQLSHLRDVLYPQGNVGTIFVDDMRQATCKGRSTDTGNSTTDWCSGPPANPAPAPPPLVYAAPDNGTCSPQGAQIFWSSIQSSPNTFYGWGYEDHALYLHHAQIFRPDDFAFYQEVRCGDGSTGNGYSTVIWYVVHQDGCFLESWIDPATGVVKKQNPVALTAMCGSGPCWTPAKAAPYYAQDVLLFLQRVGNGPNCGTGGAGDPTAVITYNCNYLYCNFDGSASTATYQITSYSWNWGDGTTSASGSPTVVHNFATPGSYTVTLTITDALPESGSSSQAVPVAAQPPTSSFYAVCNLTSCTFYSGNSKPGSAAIHSYSWTFGDGATDVVPFPSHTYAAGGSYAVTLIVTDDFNISTASTVTVAVTGPPAARIAFSCSGLGCNFDAGGSTPGSSPISTYGWAFGDGVGGSGITVSHTYAASGTYTVTLTATDTQGQAGTQSQPVTVTAPVPPAASFLFTCSLLTCSFDGSGSSAGTNPVASYGWSFGDTTTGSGVTASHAYAASGQYAVTLTVTDTAGLSATASKVASVSSAGPTAAESFFSLTPCRLLDTRNTGGPLGNGQSRLLTAAGACGIPATAKAVSVVVTAVSPTYPGRIALFRGDQTYVADVTGNTFNFIPQTSPRSNDEIVALAGNGTLGVGATFGGSPGQVQVLLDVDGYFSEDTAPAAGAVGPLGYQAVTNCRLADTRPSSPLVAGTVRTFSAQGGCGIPAGAAVASLRVGVSAPSVGGGFTVYPSNLASSPGTTTLNFVSGIAILRNEARVGLASTTPDFSVVYNTTGAAGSSAFTFVDTNGYFKSDAPLKYHPIAACRVYNATLSGGTTQMIQVQGNCGVPVGAAAIFARLLVLGPTATGDVTLRAADTTPPAISTIKFDAGEVSLSLGTIVPLASTTPPGANDLAIFNNVPSSATAQVVIDIHGYFATAPPTVSFTSACSALSCSFDGSGSTAGSGTISSYAWTFGDAASGSGSPAAHTYAAAGSYTVTLTVTNSFGLAASTSHTVTTAVPAAASFIFTCSSLTCGFDGSGSTAGTYPITSYAWSFGDAASASGTTSSHTYPAPASYTMGRYSVTLTLTDSANIQSSVVRMVSVNGDSPLPAENYFALPPCRIADTRNSPFTVLTSGQAQTFQVTGTCGIPSSAKAVSLTVTVVGQTGGGFLALFPGDKTPTVTSIDFDPARGPRATNTIELLALNGAGTIGVMPSVAGSPGQVHLILDVDGYFSEDTAPAPAAQGPLGYQAITPCRVVDTRTTNTPLVSGTVSSFTIQGTCGIPAGAVTAALNAASIAPSYGGFLTLYPSSPPGTPTDSNLNWLAGTTAIANGARPKLAAATPDLSVMFSAPAGSTTHLVLDTMGYFKAGAPYKYHPVAECRAVYTAGPGEGTPSLAAGTTRSFQIQGNCGVPLGAKAAFIKTSLHPLSATTAGLFLLFPFGGSPNGTSFLNWDAGEAWMSGGAIVALSSTIPDISVATSGDADLIIKVFGYFQ